MAKTFTTTCPHCRETIQVAYKDAMVQMAKKSGERRKGNSTYMKKLADKRWAKLKKAEGSSVER